jgi:glycosyltransferase involved in cell wall biosynthesis
MMKSVVMIAHAFPPEGNAGVYRPLRFVRYLQASGLQVSVIASTTNNYERYDPELLALVPSEAEVVRVPSCDLWQAFQAWRGRRIQEKACRSSSETAAQIRASHDKPLRSRIRAIVRAIEASCYHPDMTMSWIRPAVEATADVCEKKRADVIWATAGPVSSFVVAQRASQHTGVPYVLDFRDAWTLTYNNGFEARRPWWARQVDKRRMYRILESAQAVVFLYSTVAECYWRAYQGALDVSKIHIIPHGYDGAIEEFNPAPIKDKCTILYTGTLVSYRYDTLLQALQQLRNSDPARAKQLRLLFVGEGTDVLINETTLLGIADIVATAGPTSHAEVNRLQREAHALLVLGRLPTIKGYELFAGAKLFGYLKAGRPIVGVLPTDETRKILQRVGVSTVADVDSPSEIIAVLRRLLDAWSAGALSSLVPDRTACEAYSAERQTAALVRALEGKPAAEPFVPGSVEIPPSLREEIGKGGWVSDGRPAWKA